MFLLKHTAKVTTFVLFSQIKRNVTGTSLAVQQLRLHVSTAAGVGLIPGWGTKILQAMWCSWKVKEKKKKCHWSTDQDLVCVFLFSLKWLWQIISWIYHPHLLPNQKPLSYLPTGRQPETRKARFTTTTWSPGKKSCWIPTSPFRWPKKLPPQESFMLIDLLLAVNCAWGLLAFQKHIINVITYVRLLSFLVNILVFLICKTLLKKIKESFLKMVITSSSIVDFSGHGQTFSVKSLRISILGFTCLTVFGTTVQFFCCCISSQTVHKWMGMSLFWVNLIWFVSLSLTHAVYKKTWFILFLEFKNTF